MIDKKTIEHIAKLARLHISDTEAEAFSQQLSKALGYFEQISTIHTEGVEPLVTPSEVEDYWREDKVLKELTADQIVANAPEKIGHLFKVPPVV